MARININAIREGDRLALSRALTAVENNGAENQAIQKALFPHTGQAHIVGVTGAPGTGKSTLVNQLVKHLRSVNNNDSLAKIAIIAVDPTSPFSGGALLGDRIRMNDLAGDKGIFIRSMASRGALGGLAHTTSALTTVLDGAGFDLILIETVGAGQSEVEIAQLAHTVIVVEAPGLGDDIQAIKAGILEIADILVVNKADRPGAENTARALQAMLEMSRGHKGTQSPIGKHLRLMQSSTPAAVGKEEYPGWAPPVQMVTAVEGKGISELADMITEHKNYLQETKLWQVKETFRFQRELEGLIFNRLTEQWQQSLDKSQYKEILEDIVQRKISPIEAVNKLL